VVEKGGEKKVSYLGFEEEGKRGSRENKLDGEERKEYSKTNR